MTRNTASNHKSSTAARTVAKVAIAGMVAGAPLAMFATPASAAGSHDWSGVAQCESGGNWSTSTGNGFSGGLQFTPQTWSAYGGQGSAQNASKSEQIRVAENVLDGQGPGAWPVCGQNLTGGSTPVQSTSNNNNAPAAATHSAPKQQQAPKQQAPKQQYQAPKQQAPQQQYQAPKQQSSNNQSSGTNYTPKSTAPTQSAPAAGADYTVKSGDTLAKIAQANGIQGGYQTLFSLNSGTISNPNMIFVGQQIALH